MTKRAWFDSVEVNTFIALFKPLSLDYEILDPSPRILVRLSGPEFRRDILSALAKETGRTYASVNSNVIQTLLRNIKRRTTPRLANQQRYSRLGNKSYSTGEKTAHLMRLTSRVDETAELKRQIMTGERASTGRTGGFEASSGKAM